MGKLIDPEKTYKYRLRSDEDNGRSMIFHIKPMTHRESLELVDSFKFTRDMKVSTNETERREEIFIKHICKIENVYWPGTESAVTIESEEDRRRIFAMLSFDDGAEIQQAIQNLSLLEEREIKN